MPHKIAIPAGAAEIISVLKSNGFDAYVVGGCVRDSILGRIPKDWDICTSAQPTQVMECLHSHRIIETGLKHGTVTVIMGASQYEVTTFRIDGKYSDNRRPDSVKYVSDIKEDLARRDFKMNAMAYNDEVGLVDPFGGMADLQNKLISCVGNPNERFDEDALRIMRALRFASVFGFEIDESTSLSIHQSKELLHNIAAERITSELCQLVCGEGVLPVLLNYSDVMSEIIPELKPCIGFNQNNKYHSYNVYDHIAVAVSQFTDSDVVVKMALLLHDIGKPCCYTEDHNGGHFHGHGVHSHKLAEQALSRMRFDNKTRDAILELVLYHDATIEPTPKTVRRWLHKIGEDQFFRLIRMRIADIKAHAPGTQGSRILKCADLCTLAAVECMNCFSMKDLAINGRDVMALGVPEGKGVGFILNTLLNMVINGDIKNEKSLLIDKATELTTLL